MNVESAIKSLAFDSFPKLIQRNHFYWINWTRNKWTQKCQVCKKTWCGHIYRRWFHRQSGNYWMHLNAIHLSLLLCKFLFHDTDVHAAFFHFTETVAIAEAVKRITCRPCGTNTLMIKKMLLSERMNNFAFILPNEIKRIRNRCLYFYTVVAIQP